MFIYFDIDGVSLEELEYTETQCVAALERLRDRIADIKQEQASRYTINSTGEACTYDYKAIVEELQRFIGNNGLGKLGLAEVRYIIDKYTEKRPLDPTEIYPCPNCREFGLTIFNDEKDNEKYIFCTNCAFEDRKLSYSTADSDIWKDFHQYLVEEGYLLS